jgi:N-methylhydantoinase A
VLQPLDEQAARQIVDQLLSEQVEAIAITFLHAYRNAIHEERMREIVQEMAPEVAVSISSEITREWREFERTSTTVLNAYSKNSMARYLGKLEHALTMRGFKGGFSVMQSTGGMTSAEQASVVPLRTLESGPAGGVIGCVRLGRQIGEANLIAADVGGTTFDVSLISGGEPLQKTESHVHDRPVLMPTLDIVSIGAGGGSIAWLDAEGGLRVGPASAQAVPGPACFGLGGTEATVTDAQLLLGYLDPETYLGKRMKLDVSASERAVGKIGAALGLGMHDTARGIVHLATMNMTYAIRNITIERGHDPREFSLVCFGGGGGLFAARLLEELEARQAIIPVFPSAFSAWGLLNADFREDAAQVISQPLDQVAPADLQQWLAALHAETGAAITRCGIPIQQQQQLDYAELRYVGQEHTLRVPLLQEDLLDAQFKALRERFHRAHEQAYAHSIPHMPIDLLKLHAASIGTSTKPQQTHWQTSSGDARKGSREIILQEGDLPVSCPVFDRDRLAVDAVIEGPAIVEEWSSTILVLPGQTLTVDAIGNLMIRRKG